MGYLKWAIGYTNHHWANWPMVFIMIGITAGSVYQCAYGLLTSRELEFYKDQKKNFIHDLENPKVKKHTYNPELWPPNCELASLYREMKAKEDERKSK